MFSERSGVVNIGLEGMMLMGAYFRRLRRGCDRLVGGRLFIGLISGALLAFVHAIFTITLRADQIVTGTAINFLALGVTGYLYNQHYGNNGTPEKPARRSRRQPEVPFAHPPAGSR
jgi:simple sugar transport system permease protein